LDDAIRELIDSHPEGGLIFDFHASDIVPREQLDYVIVMRCESDILYRRLQARGYSEAKVSENVQAEIFGVIAGEIEEDVPEEMIIEVVSNVPENLEEAVETVASAIAGTA
jgi:adenylate kinase